MIEDPREPNDRVRSSDEDLHDDDQGPGPEVSPIVVDAIAKALQSHFRAIAELPLPDRFLVLLAELEARERRNET
jgi:hypothetical protein